MTGIIAGSKVLVTGAYGLIGHEVVLLLRRNGFDVVPADILASPPPDAEFSAVPMPVSGVDSIAQFLTRHGIGSIVHCAGISGPMLARDRPYDVMTANVSGTLDLYEAARRSGALRIVLMSSVSAYGAVDCPNVDETTPLAASDVYGISKAAGELVARAYSVHGVETVILRPCWVYGRRRRTSCVIQTMVADAFAGRTSHFGYGRGFPRQFVHVQDVAVAVMMALRTDKGVNRVFNIADGRRHFLDDVAELVRGELPQARIEMADGPDPEDVVCGLLDIRSARENLGWRPTISLQAGIRRTIAESRG